MMVPLYQIGEISSASPTAYPGLPPSQSFTAFPQTTTPMLTPSPSMPSLQTASTPTSKDLAPSLFPSAPFQSPGSTAITGVTPSQLPISPNPFKADLGSLNITPGSSNLFPTTSGFSSDIAGISSLAGNATSPAASGNDLFSSGVMTNTPNTSIFGKQDPFSQDIFVNNNNNNNTTGDKHAAAFAAFGSSGTDAFGSFTKSSGATTGGGGGTPPKLDPFADLF